MRAWYSTRSRKWRASVSIFDPDFTSRRITAELPNVTLEQALDAVCLESKSFWKAVTPNVIFVAPDQPQKRKDLEDEVVQTFYLSNTLTPQDLTEIVNGLRQLLDLHRLQQVNSQNAIVIRDTPDKLSLAAKIIRDIDKAKPGSLNSRAGDDRQHGPAARPRNATGSNRGDQLHAEHASSNRHLEQQFFQFLLQHVNHYVERRPDHARRAEELGTADYSLRCRARRPMQF